MAKPVNNDYQNEGTAFEIAFYEGGLRISPQNTGVMAGLAAAYTASGRFEDGLVIDRMLVALLPSDSTVRYNLACSLSLTGRLDGCIQELLKAIALGYEDRGHLLNDPDLAAVRGHELWPMVIEFLDKKRVTGLARAAKRPALKPWVDTLKQVDGKGDAGPKAGSQD